MEINVRLHFSLCESGCFHYYFCFYVCKSSKKSQNIQIFYQLFYKKNFDFNIVHKHTIKINAQKYKNVQVFEY